MAPASAPSCDHRRHQLTLTWPLMLSPPQSSWGCCPDHLALLLPSTPPSLTPRQQLLGTIVPIPGTHWSPLQKLTLGHWSCQKGRWRCNLSAKGAV